jgi:hypothetical protein
MRVVMAEESGRGQSGDRIHNPPSGGMMSRRIDSVLSNANDGLKRHKRDLYSR